MKYKINFLIIVNMFAGDVTGEFITHSVGQGNCQTCVYTIQSKKNRIPNRCWIFRNEF